VETRLIIAIIVVIVAIAFVAGWLYSRSRRRAQLRERFGPEYDHAVSQAGDVSRAEATLAERERRHQKLHIRPLTPEESNRFTRAWRSTQSMFVDDPGRAIRDADTLVTDVMSTRGYPMADWDQRVADISVDYPLVCDHYRQGHKIAIRQQRGEASTEDLRAGLLHYRELFTELVEGGAARQARQTDQRTQRRAG